MIATFPDYPVLQQASNIKPVSNVRRVDYERGLPSKQAPGHCNQMIDRDLIYRLCSAADIESFAFWFRDDIKMASHWFLWRCPTREASRQAVTLLRVRVKFGQYEINFTSQDQTQAEVKFTIEYWSGDGF